MVHPVELSDEQVQAAAEGRLPAEVLAPAGPVELTDEQVRAATEGRSPEVLNGK